MLLFMFQNCVSSDTVLTQPNSDQTDQVIGQAETITHHGAPWCTSSLGFTVVTPREASAPKKFSEKKASKYTEGELWTQWS